MPLFRKLSRKLETLEDFGGRRNVVHKRSNLAQVYPFFYYLVVMLMASSKQYLSIVNTYTIKDLHSNVLQFWKFTQATKCRCILKIQLKLEAKTFCNYYFFFSNREQEFYLGMCLIIFMNFNSCETHKAVDKVIKAPAWWRAATGTGTYNKRVVMPSPTCEKK